MARKYKRDKNGRFAGGGTQVTSRSSGPRPQAAAGKRQIPRKGSAAMKRQQANPSGQRLMKTKKAAKGVGKFVKNNPGMVTTAVVYGGLYAVGGQTKSKMANAVSDTIKYASNKVSDKRGIGGKPGANLRSSKKNLRGSYKIRST
jgi:phage gpG-like protein